MLVGLWVLPFAPGAVGQTLPVLVVASTPYLEFQFLDVYRGLVIFSEIVLPELGKLDLYTINPLEASQC